MEASPLWPLWSLLLVTSDCSAFRSCVDNWSDVLLCCQLTLCSNRSGVWSTFCSSHWLNSLGSMNDFGAVIKHHQTPLILHVMDDATAATVSHVRLNAAGKSWPFLVCVNV